MRAQASLFMILAVLVVVFAVVLTVVSRQSRMIAQPSLPRYDSNVQQVRHIVQSCLDESLKQGLLLFGLQGGYIFPRVLVESLDVDGFAVPYYVYEGSGIIPNQEMLKDAQLAGSVQVSVNLCLEQFAEVPFSVQWGPAQVRISWLPSQVMADASIPAMIGPPQSQTAVSPKYAASVRSRLSQTVEWAREIASDPDMTRGLVDLAYLETVSDAGYNITIFPYDNDRFFFVMTDNVDRLYDLPYRFQFAVKVKGNA